MQIPDVKDGVEQFETSGSGQQYKYKQQHKSSSGGGGIICDPSSICRCIFSICK